jgi:hypothetical protein
MPVAERTRQAWVFLVCSLCLLSRQSRECVCVCVCRPFVCLRSACVCPLGCLLPCAQRASPEKRQTGTGTGGSAAAPAAPDKPREQQPGTRERNEHSWQFSCGTVHCAVRRRRGHCSSGPACCRPVRSVRVESCFFLLSDQPTAIPCALWATGNDCCATRQRALTSSWGAAARPSVPGAAFLLLLLSQRSDWPSRPAHCF